MKKIALFLFLLPFLAVAVQAQESRQDISVSATGFLPPYVNSSKNVYLTPTYSLGGLLSYRYMLTPHSAVELNYQLTENTNRYRTAFPNYRIHTRVHEISGAYVYNFSYKHFNPFVEAGVGGYIFSPLDDPSTTIGVSDIKRKTAIGFLYGAGIAYEISPSFDIRVEYRGIVVKAPDFGYSDISTSRYTNIHNPAVGVAYHF